MSDIAVDAIDHVMIMIAVKMIEEGVAINVGLSVDTDIVGMIVTMITEVIAHLTPTIVTRIKDIHITGIIKVQSLNIEETLLRNTSILTKTDKILMKRC